MSKLIVSLLPTPSLSSFLSPSPHHSVCFLTHHNSSSYVRENEPDGILPQNTIESAGSDDGPIIDRSSYMMITDDDAKDDNATAAAG